MPTLDPEDWSSLRALGHRMMDDMFDHLATLPAQPVWRPMPGAIRAAFTTPLPANPTSPETLYETFSETIKPYVTGNTHPRFMGWVHGGGNPVSMLADLLAGALNANCGGRDHSGIALERQVIAWAASMLGLPEETSGVLLTGSSMANFVALLCARQKMLGGGGREHGLAGCKLTAYTSAAAHRCIASAMDMSGLGTAALRKIPVNASHQLDQHTLRSAIAADKAAGHTPFFLAATAGTVDTGAFDALTALAGIARDERLWFHVDAAFGALAALSPAHAHLTEGIQHADSVAFDFHKWAQVSYDSGCVLIRDPALHLATFAQPTAYLASAPRGLAGGHPWPCDLGPDLSRGFRALKIWMTLSAYGTAGLAGVVETTCTLAQHLASRIKTSDALELLAPVPLNIVCFAPTGVSDAQTEALVADLQEDGLFAPSTTRINNRLAIRAAIVNHRTQQADIDAFVEEVLRKQALLF